MSAPQKEEKSRSQLLFERAQKKYQPRRSFSEEITSAEPSGFEMGLSEVFSALGRGAASGIEKIGLAFGGGIQGRADQPKERFAPFVKEQLQEPETAIGRGIERIAETGTSVMAGGGIAGAPRALASIIGGGAAAQAVKELGAPEEVASLVEVAALLGPDVFKKVIEPSKKVIRAAATGEVTTQKEMVERARQLGMSEEEIAPLVREGKFRDILEKVTPKRGAIQKDLEKTAQSVSSRNFRQLAESPLAQKSLSQRSSDRMISQLERKLDELPAKAREMIMTDYQQLMQSDMQGRDLMKFWGDINAYFKQYPRLQDLKGPIRDALKSSMPELSSQFEMANTLSQRYREISKRLKPSIASDLFGGSEGLALVGSVVTGNLPLTAKIGSIAASRKLAQLMLTNPRFQNLSRKLVSSLNQGQSGAAFKSYSSLISLVASEDPELAKEMRKLSKEELESVLVK